MLYNIVRQINWVDIFVIIALFRICYVAVNTGLPIEIFKILGTIAATYLSLHFYTSFTYFIQSFAGFKSIPVGFYDLLSFVTLAIFGYMIFVFLRKFLANLMNLETVTILNKWMGLALGVARSLLLTSLLICMFVISGSDYFKTSIKDSYSGKTIFKIAPAAYSLMWSGVASKLLPGEKFNKNVSEAKLELYK